MEQQPPLIPILQITYSFIYKKMQVILIVSICSNVLFYSYCNVSPCVLESKIFSFLPFSFVINGNVKNHSFFKYVLFFNLTARQIRPVSSSFYSLYSNIFLPQKLYQFQIKRQIIKKLNLGICEHNTVFNLFNNFKYQLNLCLLHYQFHEFEVILCLLVFSIIIKTFPKQEIKFIVLIQIFVDVYV